MHTLPRPLVSMCLSRPLALMSLSTVAASSLSFEPLKTRQLGSSSLRVTEACLGTMRLTPPQPDPPRLRQILAICSLFCRAEPCSAQIVPISKYSIPMEIHPRMRGSTVSTKVDNYQQPPESVRGGAVSECGVSAAWARGMPRAGWAGRPTPVLPCAQDSAHEQGAIELTWTYLQRVLQRLPLPRASTKGRRHERNASGNDYAFPRSRTPPPYGRQ